MGEEQHGDKTAAASEVLAKAVEKLSSKAGAEVSATQRSALEVLSQGRDLQLYAPAVAARTHLYGAWLAASGMTGMVVVGTEEQSASVTASLVEAGCEATAAITPEEFAAALKSKKGVVVAPIAAAAAAFKGGNSQLISAVAIIDGVEQLTEHVSSNEIEGFLFSFREINPESQMALIANEASLQMSALGRRFLNNSKNVSIKGETVTDIQHVYYEVGTTLLAKPQALCDLVELEGASTCLVFCNSPSDADFADVILKKRGLTSTKLIGYVPQLKLSKAIQQIQKKEVMTLVLTDVAARGVPLEEFDVVVNYSIPTDPEVYFHRYSGDAGAQTKKVVSLVAPLDIANFHYLKKLGKLEFVQESLPSPEQLFVTKYTQLQSQALERPFLSDPGIATLVDKVLGDEKVKDVVALLLHNTLSVIPSLKNATTSKEDVGEEYEEGDDYEDRRGRGGRGQQGGRGGNRERGGNFRGGNQRGGNFDDHQPDRQFGEFGEEDEDSQPRRGRGRDRGDRHDRGDRPDRGERGGDRGERRERQPRRQMVVDKEARLYVGAGARQGISAEKLSNDVVSLCGVAATDVHRVSVRDLYTFVDVPEAVADQVIEKLSEAAVGQDGEKYFVKKAVTLSIPREGAQVEDNEGAGDMAGEHTSHIDNGGMMEEGEQGFQDDEGPTMLNID
jgi:superfamily II DNA/RNA helicase